MPKITLRRASLAQIREMALRSEIFYMPAPARGARHVRQSAAARGTARTASDLLDPKAFSSRKKMLKS